MCGRSAAAAEERADRVVPERSSIAVRRSSLSQLPESPTPGTRTPPPTRPRRRWGRSGACPAACTRPGEPASARSTPRTPRGTGRASTWRRRPIPRRASRRPVEADRPREAVVVERPVGEDLRQPAVRGTEQQVDLEQAFAGRDEPLREPQVVERRGADVRHAPAVAEDLDRRGEARRRELTLLGQERRGGDLAELFDEVAHACEAYRSPVRRAPRACCPASSRTARRTRRRAPAARRACPARRSGPRRTPARGPRLRRRQPVRDRDHGPSGRQPPQRLGDAPLGRRVHRARRLVQDQQARLVDLRAGERDQLTLADRQASPRSPTARVQPVAAASRPSRPGRARERGLDVAVASPSPPVPHVLTDRRVEQEPVLRDHADRAPARRRRHVAEIHPVHLDVPRRRDPRDGTAASRTWSSASRSRRRRPRARRATSTAIPRSTGSALTVGELRALGPTASAPVGQPGPGRARRSRSACPAR